VVDVEPVGVRAECALRPAPAPRADRDLRAAAGRRRVVLTVRSWGQLWHLDGTRRQQRNAILRARDTYYYSFTDWIYGPTALTPDQEPALYRPIPLDSIEPEPEPPAFSELLFHFTRSRAQSIRWS
jgi:hypothetical protein